MTLEQTIEKHINTLVRQLGGITIKLNDPQQAGLPDRLILLPGGKTTFIEYKQPGKHPTPLQQHRHKQLQHLGHTVHTVDSTTKGTQIIHELHTTPLPNPRH